MDTMELVTPTATLRESYCSFIGELVATGEAFVPFVLEYAHDDFGAFLHRLDDCARGIGLPHGFVAHSTYWLVADRTTVVGVSNIRHSLTDSLRREGGNIGYGIRPSARRRGFGTAILRESLRRAAQLGLTRVLVTCSKENLGSVKAIVRNGGVLESEEYLPARSEIIQRYWIRNGPRAEA
jgi:predicted acetyltransferase